MYISNKIIGDHIKLARKQAGLTQQELAHKIGLSLYHFGHIERGTRPASVEVLGRLSVQLQRPIEYFISGAVVEVLQDIEMENGAAQIDRIVAMMDGCSEPVLDMLAEIVDSVVRYEKR